MDFAPIVLFAYNRPVHLKNTIDSLLKNNLAAQSHLFVFSDGPKNDSASDSVKQVRDYLKTVTGFSSFKVIERERNYGLAQNVILGVTEIIDQFKKVIVLEDDMITSPFFLEYMNQALSFYENEDQVISIHGYLNPIKDIMNQPFFLKGADCWGWATWKRGWDLFEKDGSKLLTELKSKHLQSEFNYQDTYDYIGMLKDQISGKNNSWAIRWYASAFLKNKLTLYPARSLVQNIGFDGSGTHCGSEVDYFVEISLKQQSDFPEKIEVSLLGYRAYCEFFDKINHKSYIKRLKIKIRSLIT